MLSKQLLHATLCIVFLSLVRCSHAFNSPKGRSLPRSDALNLFKKGNSRPQNLPRPDPENPERYISTLATSSDFYPTYISLLRNGPLPFVTRLTSPDKYEQAVYKYQYESKESDLEEAQANMDAFFSSPDVWAEQKMREQKGERETYKYARPLDQERVVLSLTWGSFVVFVAGKIIWKGILHF